MVTFRYLLDTNILSEPLRAHPDPQLLERIEQYQGAVATAAVVWHELWFGARRLPESKKRRAIEAYLNELLQSRLPVLPYDQTAATWHAAERARLASIGKTPPFADGQIAAIARTNELTVVTANEDDFQQFAGLEVENWLQ